MLMLYVGASNLLFRPVFISAGSFCGVMPESSSKPLHTGNLICSPSTVQDTSDQNRAAMYREDAEHHDITFLQVRYRSMLITWRAEQQV